MGQTVREIVTINRGTCGPRLHVSSIYRLQQQGTLSGHHWAWHVDRYRVEDTDGVTKRCRGGPKPSL